MIKFRQKDFSAFSNILSDMGKYAAIGAAATPGLGLGIKAFRMKKAGSDKKATNDFNKDWNVRKGLYNSAMGALYGAALGLFVGSVKEISKAVNRSRTVDARLMQTVIEMLKKSGLREGKDFTRDPKAANELKTKVCIVVSKVSNDLRLAINTVSDQKLKNVTKDVVKNIPNTSAVTEKVSDKYNDITISTISDSSADAGLVAGIAQSFIHSGYPVYLVEVG